MAPIYLIHWGDPKEEADEIEEVIGTWLMENCQPECVSKKVVKNEPESLRRALQAAVEDPGSQIIYLSCHGNEQGIAFSSQGEITPYALLSRWLFAMNPPDSRNETGFWEKTLVFGFCESMNPTVGIENLMPPWVTQVVGFVGSPLDTDVAQLAAGYVINLNNWVHEVFAEYFVESNANPARAGETQWEATGRAFDVAAERTPDYPAQNVLKKNQVNVVIATKDIRNGTWTRKKGI